MGKEMAHGLAIAITGQCVPLHHKVNKKGGLMGPPEAGRSRKTVLWHSSGRGRMRSS